MQQNGGTITVTSEVGEGSTVVVDPPRAVREQLTPLPAQAAQTARGGTETVLLVEDEEAVRNLTRRLLEHYGYAVLSAPSGEAALVRVRPGMRRIFMSGYAATTLEQRVLLDPDSAFLQKPFTSAQLAGRVRQMLDEPELAGAGTGEG